jgi:hypothetical protein
MFGMVLTVNESRDSSVSIATEYGLDDQDAEILVPVE